MRKNLCLRFGRFNGLVLFNLLLLFCYSCKKEEPQVILPIVTNEGITFRDGRLIFTDNASFMDHQKWLSENQNNPQLLAEKNKALGLKSMTEYYFEGMKLEENDPRFVDYVTEYPSVFNKETYENSTLYVLPQSNGMNPRASSGLKKTVQAPRN